MSEEKLYMVKNDEGSYITVTNGWLVHWHENSGDLFSSHQEASKWATTLGGHVVTLIEEPEKVVLSKYQAEIVEKTRVSDIPATYISCLGASGEEELLMEAYVNGYTVKKEIRYLVELDGLVTTDGAKQYLTKKYGKWFACRRMPGMHQDFTDEELKTAPDWAQQMNREEVADDEQ